MLPDLSLTYDLTRYRQIASVKGYGKLIANELSQLEKVDSEEFTSVPDITRESEFKENKKYASLTNKSQQITKKEQET